MRDRIGKKGMEQQVIIGGILFLIVAGVLFYWVGERLIPTIEEGNERAACRASVDVNAKRVSLGDLEVMPAFIDVQCKTIPKEIGGSTKEEVFGQVADLMAMAWEDFRRGERNIFEDETAVFCMPRYAPITFADSPEEPYTHFFSYLVNNKPYGIDETYAEYFMNRQLSVDEAKGLMEVPDFINPSMQYAVIITLAHQSSWDAFFEQALKYSFAPIPTLLVEQFDMPEEMTVFIPNYAAQRYGYEALGDWLFDVDYSDALANDVYYAYSVGSNSGSQYVARLYFIPYDRIADLECDKLKLNRYLV